MTTRPKAGPGEPEGQPAALGAASAPSTSLMPRRQTLKEGGPGGRSAPLLWNRDTLCSCEAYGMKPIMMYKKKKKKTSVAPVWAGQCSWSARTGATAGIRRPTRCVPHSQRLFDIHVVCAALMQGPVVSIKKKKKGAGSGEAQCAPRHGAAPTWPPTKGAGWCCTIVAWAPQGWGVAPGAASASASTGVAE
jgi:hypothetical protein